MLLMVQWWWALHTCEHAGTYINADMGRGEAGEQGKMNITVSHGSLYVSNLIMGAPTQQTPVLTWLKTTLYLYSKSSSDPQPTPKHDILQHIPGHVHHSSSSHHVSSHPIFHHQGPKRLSAPSCLHIHGVLKCGLSSKMASNITCPRKVSISFSVKLFLSSLCTGRIPSLRTGVHLPCAPMDYPIKSIDWDPTSDVTVQAPLLGMPVSERS